MYLEVSVQLWHLVRVSLENLTFVTSYEIYLLTSIVDLYIFSMQKKRELKYKIHLPFEISYFDREARDFR